MFDMIVSYFGMTFYPLILIGFLAYLGRSFRQERKKIILCAVILLFVLLPVLYVVCNAIGQGAETYRFLWLLPLSLIVAFLVVDLIRRTMFDPKAVLVMTALCLMSLGSVLFMKSTWSIPQNPYDLNDEMIDVAEAIDEDCKGAEVRIIGDTQIMIQLRQYKENLCWAYTGRGQMMDALQNGVLDDMAGDPQYRLALAIQQDIVLDEDALMNDIDGLQVDYIVLSDENSLPSYLSGDRMRLVDHTKHYDVYKWN